MNDVAKAVMFVWLLVTLCAPLAVHAAPEALRDAIVERTWLDDPQGTLSPREALAGQWTPFSGSLSRGYTASTTWLRLKIDPAAAGPGGVTSDHRLVLRILPVHLDEIIVFRTNQLAQEPVRVGDTTERSRAGSRFIYHAVVIEDAPQPFEVLLRLRTASNHSIYVQALTWDDALEVSFNQLIHVLAYLVFTSMVIAWAFAVWLEHRDAVLGLFIAHQLSALVLSLTLMGVLRLAGPDWLTAAVIDRLTSLMIPVHTAITAIFHSRLLSDLGGSRIGNRLLKLLTGAALAGLMLVAAGEVRPGLMLTQSTVLVVMPLFVLVACQARPDLAVGGGSGSAWWRVYLVVVYVAMAALTTPQSLRVLGLLPAGVWTYSGFIAYGLASTVLLGSLLLLRARQERHRRLQSALAFRQAQQEARVERERAAEQAELMTMLAHELKTPLSVVSLALGNRGNSASMRERAHRAVDNIRNVIDRCEQAALVDDADGRRDAFLRIAPLAMDELLAEALNTQLLADRVDCRVASELPVCLADRQMLLVIIGNMLENALKYSPLEARVQASVESAAMRGRQGVLLRVANQVGAAGRPDPDRVFEKYHRGALARRQSGSGLGLYLSRRLAERSGGMLTLRDAQGDQVCFDLWLPAAESA